MGYARKCERNRYTHFFPYLLTLWQTCVTAESEVLPLKCFSREFARKRVNIEMEVNMFASCKCNRRKVKSREGEKRAPKEEERERERA